MGNSSHQYIAVNLERNMFKTKIIGTGSVIPDLIVTNEDFSSHEFYDENQKKLEISGEVIVRKFKSITGIEERKYASQGLNTSDLAAEAALKAIADSGIDPETLDHIIVAHNFGNIVNQSIQSDAVPSLAARVKHALKIRNPKCVAYDMLFGCPGWVQAFIQADCFFKAGVGKRALVIGAETLSRVTDPHDRDSMIFSDGAGACVLEFKDSDSGLLNHCTLSHSMEEVDYIYFGASYKPDSCPNHRYIKMKGRKVYEYALKQVPLAIKECIDDSNIGIENIKKIFIHQANEKMDEAIIRDLYKLYNVDAPEKIMPMCIHKFGNSSVATVPTLYDMVVHNRMEDHKVDTGDAIVFASVGAGMNINAFVYVV